MINITWSTSITVESLRYAVMWFNRARQEISPPSKFCVNFLLHNANSSTICAKYCSNIICSPYNPDKIVDKLSFYLLKIKNSLYIFLYEPAIDVRHSKTLTAFW